MIDYDDARCSCRAGGWMEGYGVARTHIIIWRNSWSSAAALEPLFLFVRCGCCWLFGWRQAATLDQKLERLTMDILLEKYVESLPNNCRLSDTPTDRG